MLAFTDDRSQKRPFDLEDIPTIFEFHKRFNAFLINGKRDGIFKETLLNIVNSKKAQKLFVCSGFL